MNKGFEQYLKEDDLADNTIVAYLYAVNLFEREFGSYSKRNLLLYKADQIEKFSPKTVNLRIQAINKYLEFIDEPKLRLKPLRIQQKLYLENVISQADYEFLKAKLNNTKEKFWYFFVRFLGATGARISEIVKFKVEHVKIGYIDLYTKGGKFRRLFIPKTLREEAVTWLNEIKRENGYLFADANGEAIKGRKARHKLQYFARKYGIEPKVMHPHSFRHRYAKNFIEVYKDIALLADLMGHESMDTTRIYLRRTASEQQEIVDNVITW